LSQNSCSAIVFTKIKVKPVLIIDITEIFKKKIFPIVRIVEIGVFIVIDDANREV
jgi:hypothetical protein